MSCVSFADVEAAFERVRGEVVETPLLRAPRLAQLGGFTELLFKCEVFQETGSFKFRGATNAIRRYLETKHAISTFVTHSSGNHGQAVARAAHKSGKKCVVVVPRNAPQVKIDGIRLSGAKIEFSDSTQKSRENTCSAVIAKFAPGHAQFVHPFDDPLVIAGQGTIGVEIVRQLKSCGKHVDAVIVPVGGGGLISGVALAIKALMPTVKVFGAEPENVDDATRSFRSRVDVPLPLLKDPATTMADGLRGTLSKRTLSLIRSNVDDMVTVSENELASAMRLVMQHLKVVIEPSAATGVAAALFHREQLQGAQRAVIILCGGNVELDNLNHIIRPNHL